MPIKDRPVLHRDDPARAPLAAHVKVTREDWLAVARDTLVRDGAAEVKIMAMADRMQVSRSSFYWYFKNRKDLLAALLTEWEARNTRHITQKCAQPTVNITEAICNFFRCFVSPDGFDQGLDFAVREWARRDETLRARIDAADSARIKALTDMFARHGFDETEADARARILYFMQLGYHALDVREPIDVRMSRVADYIKGFSGQDPEPAALATFLEDFSSLGAG